MHKAASELWLLDGSMKLHLTSQAKSAMLLLLDPLLEFYLIFNNTVVALGVVFKQQFP